jgi:hypothetical protein
MTTLFLFLFGALAGTFVGDYIASKLFYNTDIDILSKPKQEPIDPEDPSCWNYSELRLRGRKTPDELSQPFSWRHENAL